MVGITNIFGSKITDLTNLPVLFFYGKHYGGGSKKIPESGRVIGYNPDYVAYIDSGDNAGKFEILKTFYGDIKVFSTSNMNKAGSGNKITYTRFCIYMNDTIYYQVTNNATGRNWSGNNVLYSAGVYTYITGWCYNTNGAISATGDYLYTVSLHTE